MPITETQRKNRINHLGGSDIPILFGLNRFKNIYDLWLNKTGQVDDALVQSEAAIAGTYFEEGVIKYIEGQLGKIKRNQYRSANGLPIGSSIDGIVVETDEPVEIKTEGLFWKLRDGWGDEGTDNVPYDVIIQCHTHMLCNNSGVCHVGAFLGGIGFRLYKINRDEEIIVEIIRRAKDFWENHVEANIAPTDTVPSIELLKRVKREPKSITEIDTGLVSAWLSAQENRKKAELLEEEAKTKMITALGNAEAATCSLGMLTYLPRSRKVFDTKRLKAEMPEVATKYETIISYRVPQLQQKIVKEN